MSGQALVPWAVVVLPVWVELAALLWHQRLGLRSVFAGVHGQCHPRQGMTSWTQGCLLLPGAGGACHGAPCCAPEQQRLQQERLLLMLQPLLLLYVPVW